MKGWWWLAIFLGGAALSASWWWKIREDGTGESGEAEILSEPEPDPAELPRIPPREPEAALASFELAPGFRLEQVACEPLVTDPIALSFDEEGRLFVVEMRDYPESREERLGRIRLLEDTDWDGKFDRSTVFADGLPWPTGVICYEGGVFVAASPDILYFKDTDGDGAADLRRVVLTGFGEQETALNVQRLPNSFNWGLDNRIHGASGHGGRIVTADRPGAGAVDLLGRDFSFDPRTLQIRPESRGGQYGMSFDDAGRKFSCSNSDHIQFLVYEDRYASRNPYYPAPLTLASIADDGPAAPVFRLSPDEPWRVVRTRWRVQGLVRGPIEGGGRPSGYFTSATGITIYRGHAFPPEYRGNAFVADVGSNLVHRKVLHPDGVALLARRAPGETRREFLASRDNWFRPTQLANAPDGTLYLTDMYREVVEHPWSIPESIRRHLDLTSGRNRGRIYRIVPEGFTQPPPPRLGSATTAQLVVTLAHPNGWHRDTASRLLYERRDPAAVPLLEKLLLDPRSPQGRLHALYALDGLQALEESHLLRALQDPDPAVRKHAARLAEKGLPGQSPSGRLWTVLSRLHKDPDPSVRFQLALTLGEFHPPDQESLAVELLSQDLENPWLQAAILTGLTRGTESLFRHLLDRSSLVQSPSGKAFLEELVQIAGARNDPTEVPKIAARIQQIPDAALRFRLVAGLAEGLERAGRPADTLQPFQPLIRRALQELANPRASEEARVQAARLLGLTRSEEAKPLLITLLGPESPPPLQQTAITALSRFSDPEVADAVLTRWKSLTPGLQAPLLDWLLSRPQHIRRLLQAIEDGTILRSELSASQLQFLRFRPDPELREWALGLLGPASLETRQQVIQNSSAALELQGDAKQGGALYLEQCSQCHRLEGEGFRVGPDLETVRGDGKEKLLTSILDPNREVAPQYLSYLVELKEGEILTGIVLAEDSHAVTLLQARGIQRELQRSRIRSIRRLNQSLMPEGLEVGLTPQDLADLLAFLLQVPASSAD